MNVLVIGGGGREHALVWKLKQSPHVKKIYCVPGNAGIAQMAECENIDVTDTRGLLSFASRKKIDFTVVGPEIPLVNGVVDDFEKNGFPIFGPNEKAAELEGSKAFCKYLLQKYNIPTAEYALFTDYDKAVSHLKSCKLPVVVKADGLAAGKGVLICETREKALEAIDLIMKKNAFGEAGRKVIVEEFLQGYETSIMAIADGENMVYMMPSQDHKRIFDNDQGPNTGGMGAYAPTPAVDDTLMRTIKSDIMEPTLKGLALEGRPYKGVLYAGIMVTATGPKVLEYNCRFGDPETQAVLPLVQSDLLEAMMAARDNTLSGFNWKNHNGAAVCVVISSGGYPGSYEKGKTILGLDGRIDDNILVFHAGTALKDGHIVTNGGRVLGVTALGKDIKSAQEMAYKAVGKIAFDGAYFRRDIAWRAIGRK